LSRAAAGVLPSVAAGADPQAIAAASSIGASPRADSRARDASMDGLVSGSHTQTLSHA